MKPTQVYADSWRAPVVCPTLAAKALVHALPMAAFTFAAGDFHVSFLGSLLTPIVWAVCLLAQEIAREVLDAARDWA